MGKWGKLFNEEMESVTVQGLKSLHQDKFLKQVKYVAQDSPFYQEKFKTADVDVSHIEDIDDIVKLPFTVKDELRDAQMENPSVGAHRARDLLDLRWVYSSSGTTGIPNYLGFTAQDITDVHAEAERKHRNPVGEAGAGSGASVENQGGAG